MKFHRKNVAAICLKLDGKFHEVLWNVYSPDYGKPNIGDAYTNAY